jgi:DNA replication and repair protein RecF
MPTLSRLALTGFRNIEQTSLQLSPGFNLFFGNNGSGKTSLLEAVYLLGMGRSFRSNQQKPLILHGASQATVFGETTEGITLGIQRPLRGAQIIKIAGKPAEGLAQLSHTLPLQLINSDTFQLLEGSPNERRQFLDWGVFHVEQSFLGHWRRARLALDQRNTLLRAGAAASEIDPWTEELANSAKQIDQARSHYVKQLQPLVDACWQQIGGLNEAELSLTYWRGWDETFDLKEQLQESFEKDRRYGFTTVGPHKADLRFQINKQPAADILSRGQLKLLICLLKVVQAQFLQQQTGISCLFLVDDLPAELDSDNRAKVCGLLAGLKSQICLTSIEQEQLASIALAQAQQKSLEMALFHVKHGKIVSV